MRSIIEAWLKRAPDVDDVVRRLAAHTGIEASMVDEIVEWAREGLVQDIDGVVGSPVFTQPALSERLANAGGVLPMFGFPTRVRTLYRTGIDNRLTLDEISDRPLDQAVSLFAPGAEVVSDGWVYTVNGFASVYRDGRGNVRTTDPIRSSFALERCAVCGSSTIKAGSAAEGLPAGGPLTCPVCAGDIEPMTVYQPAVPDPPPQGQGRRAQRHAGRDRVPPGAGVDRSRGPAAKSLRRHGHLATGGREPGHGQRQPAGAVRPVPAQ